MQDKPFVVAGAACAAPARVGTWSRTVLEPRLPEDASVRTRLAAHWTQVGLMEHASIAALARRSLQLLSLGAPAELVEQSNRALGDELAHADIAFALASAYSGVSVGPGCLSLANALEHESPEKILELVVLEGCIGETVAALEAREAAMHCADPVVRAALERIADDETRHAALAWRTVRGRGNRAVVLSGHRHCVRGRARSPGYEPGHDGGPRPPRRAVRHAAFRTASADSRGVARGSSGAPGQCRASSCLTGARGKHSR